MPEVTQRSTVFSTPWFDIIARQVNGLDNDEPYYAVQGADSVTILAQTAKQEVLLVRQYRPALESFTIELPSGHIDSGEEPEQAAHRELIEETGYRATSMELLATLIPDTGRISGRVWCFYANEVYTSEQERKLESGVEVMLWPRRDLARHVTTVRGQPAVDLALLFLAVVKNKIALTELFP